MGVTVSVTPTKKKLHREMSPQYGPRLDEPIRVGDRLVTPSANEIDGVRVDSKAMEVLVALAAAAPEVVAGAALLETIWADVVVVDNVVYQAIAQLRKVLGDDARAPRYIETVPRRGYRLIAPVVPVAPKTSDNDVSKRRRHNLPAQLTSFIGRERDVVEIGGLLEAHRLVTLTGVGGCGKTRLALAVANVRLDDFDDGVWLVELAPVADATQVFTRRNTEQIGPFQFQRNRSAEDRRPTCRVFESAA